jgi:2-C-methyl-D-erythritol 4-phosphate cytidylyltransferase
MAAASRVWCDGGVESIDEQPEVPPVVGTACDDGRGSLPYALLHGDSLVATASEALGAAEIELIDFTTPWTDLQERGCVVVLHDTLCPLTPPAFLAEIADGIAGSTVRVGVRPVTDTIKTSTEEQVGETVDRDALWTVTSPVVLGAQVVAALDAWPDGGDFAALVERLREQFDLEPVTAPPLGRRVEDESDLAVLAAMAEDAQES